MVGFNDGSVKLFKVSYPSTSDSKIMTIIIIGVVVFVVVAIASTCLAIYCFKKSSKVEEEEK
jgi:preprotein translocase subunit SecE